MIDYSKIKKKITWLLTKKNYEMEKKKTKKHTMFTHKTK